MDTFGWVSIYHPIKGMSDYKKCALASKLFVLDYNRIPVDIRTSTSLAVFKRRLKQWIKANIEFVQIKMTLLEV